MAAEFEFHATLFSTLKEHIAEFPTDFDEPEGEKTTDTGSADIFIPSKHREGLVIEVKRADIDPHSIDVIQQAHRYARDLDTEFFATANPNDIFLFRRSKSATSVNELDRKHYDLRVSSLKDIVAELLEDVVDIQIGTGTAHEFDELIVSRLRSFHTSIYPLYEDLISDQYEVDSDFRDALVDWAKENDYPYERPGLSETFEIAAQQHAYLLMNRIVFYELVREQDVQTNSGFPLDPIFGGVSVDRLDEYLQKRFQSIMDEIDYEAIFKDDSNFFREIPDNDATKTRLHTFTKSIEQEPLSSISVDVVGQIYQKLIPVEERKELGQFYTPDEIGQILARWSIQSNTDRFLDPCSGSGSITVEAYKRMDQLDGLSHRDIIQQITAVDINKFPLHLTALNLATRDIHEPTNELFAYHEDFFDLDPETKRLESNRLGVRGTGDDDSEPEPIGKFDATAANPPYVRQEYLYPDRDHFRSHLKRFGPSSKDIYYDGGEKSIDGRSDLYCYFLTHVTSFLREGGRLAWIIPTKWMVADYGPSLQQFLFDHYQIEAVVGFRKRVFSDALVDTVLLMMVRTDDPDKRRSTVTNFVRINDTMDPDSALHVINQDYGISDEAYMKIHSRPNYRTIAVRQTHLEDNVGQKLHHFINAPALYTAVLEHPQTVELQDIAEIKRGKKTGANPIFILDHDEIQSRTIEARFLRPAVKSVKEVTGYQHTADDAKKWLLDMNEYVEEIIGLSNIEDTSDLADRVLKNLRADGYDGVYSYLQYAETLDARDNDSLKSHDPWFNLGDLDDKACEIICPQAMDTRRFFIRTDGKVVPSNRFLLVHSSVDSELLLGILNSSITKIVIESHGRVTGGGAVNLSASDLRTLRVVNPAILTDDQKETVRNGFTQLLDGDETALGTIDEVLIETLGLDVTVEEVQEISKALKLARREKGQEVETLIKELDELEGRIEMTFEETTPRQEGLSSFD